MSKYNYQLSIIKGVEGMPRITTRDSERKSAAKYDRNVSKSWV